MREIDAAIVAASAATLRQVAEWGPTSREELIEVAEGIEGMNPNDPMSLMCCPLCEEVTCDDHCALSAVRREGVA